ncbi:MAG: cytochrome c maturation protein CcmE [Endozoicomonadaceae bacterium]|nr:cytochrome c maturation protein CcmE [Endozoicomonadaceae bacterium]
MNPIRRKRLILILVILTGVSLTTLLAAIALKESISLFYTPTSLISSQTPITGSIQVGGIVVENSIQRAPNNLKKQFQITDKQNTLTIDYTGVFPDLFRENSGIIAYGSFKDHVFYATKLLAKHSADYMPKTVEQAIKKLHDKQLKVSAL